MEAKDGESGVGGLGSYEERDVKDRVVLITGASRGMGRLLATKMHSKGAIVIAVARNEKRLNELKDELKERISVYACDIGDAAKVKELFVKISSDHKHIDMVVNNAGVMFDLGMAPPMVDDAHDLTTLRVNVDGSHFVTKYALPLLLASPAGFERTVLFVSSCEGFLTEPTDANGLLAYRASKAAVNGLMVGLNQMYGSDDPMASMMRGGAEAKIPRIASVHPGYVQTGLGFETEAAWEPELTPEEFAKRKDPKDGYVSVEEGIDTMLWALTSKDGTVESGKLYAERKAHSF